MSAKTVSLPVLKSCDRVSSGSNCVTHVPLKYMALLRTNTVRGSSGPTTSFIFPFVLSDVQVYAFVAVIYRYFFHGSKVGITDGIHVLI